LYAALWGLVDAMPQAVRGSLAQQTG
jgi:hypothetical protein